MKSEEQKVLQVLCPKGHYHRVGIEEYHHKQLKNPNKKFVCPICNKPIVWMNEMTFYLDIYDHAIYRNKCDLVCIREEEVVYDEVLDTTTIQHAQYKIPE